MRQVKLTYSSIQDIRLSWHLLPGTGHCREKLNTARKQLSNSDTFMFSSTLTECRILIFACLFFSHITNLHGPPSSLILKTFAPKKPPCSYGVKYYWPLRQHPEESRQALPCILDLYSTILYSRITDPCCCNKHKGALMDGLTLSIPPVWLSDAR